ncbi:D-cysteine desulfhydrase [Marinomonas aquimarina]|uniref:D-cysteine desulfhydrase n=1 Tax=Marinomonas aquimarina TaxID=295068 RepID=A0A1A8TGA6_9GAMM|nr:hypothetical protein [Marinomonas aquimarina]SBS31283.1 D-cysteine desulfhydrase [Marinomonas aquimarina]
MYLEPIHLPANNSSDAYEFVIYRGDLECSSAPGNKQHKLKYHLQQALQEHKSIAATFGGPHSNHVAAFVARCVELQITPIVVVRGETWASLTPTLRRAVQQGAILFPSSRLDYRLGMQSKIKDAIDQYYAGEVYWVPEGGAGALGVLGCLDWANHIYQKLNDSSYHVCLASGTGATAAGFAASDFNSVSVFSALKGAHNLEQDLYSHCLAANIEVTAKLECFDESLHGGFGKMSDALIHFLHDMLAHNPTLRLDPVYTAKMVYKVNQLLAQGSWPHRKTVFIHTGGLQGWRGMPVGHCPYNENDWL